jgi:prevent-host-death family protein
MAKRTVRETVNIYEAKTQLSALVERVAAGHEVVIAKAGKPKALLVPYAAPPVRRVPGQGRGKWHVGREFDAPLPADVLGGFEGR